MGQNRARSCPCPVCARFLPGFGPKITRIDPDFDPFSTRFRPSSGSRSHAVSGHSRCTGRHLNPLPCPYALRTHPVDWHRLSQTRPDYFQLWEQGRGPGQIVLAEPEIGEPGLLRKAVHLGQAAVRHAADGLQKVDDVDYESRLAICRGCPVCDVERLVCRDGACECYLQIKARWRSESCPRSQWPEVGGS